MENKSKVILSFTVLFFGFIIYPSVTMGQEYTYETCLDTKKTLDENAKELGQQNDSIKRDLLAAEHNLAVQNFNVRCGNGGDSGWGWWPKR